MNSANDYALDLFIGQKFVARLEFHPEQDAFSLIYSPTWAADRRGYALSPHLPLDGKATSSSIRHFLENLESRPKMGAKPISLYTSPPRARVMLRI